MKINKMIELKQKIKNKEIDTITEEEFEFLVEIKDKVIYSNTFISSLQFPITDEHLTDIIGKNGYVFQELVSYIKANNEGKLSPDWVCKYLLCEDLPMNLNYNDIDKNTWEDNKFKRTLSTMIFDLHDMEDTEEEYKYRNKLSDEDIRIYKRKRTLLVNTFNDMFNPIGDKDCYYWIENNKSTLEDRDESYNTSLDNFKKTHSSEEEFNEKMSSIKEVNQTITNLMTDLSREDVRFLNIIKENSLNNPAIVKILNSYTVPDLSYYPKQFQDNLPEISTKILKRDVRSIQNASPDIVDIEIGFELMSKNTFGDSYLESIRSYFIMASKKPELVDEDLLEAFFYRFKKALNLKEKDVRFKMGKRILHTLPIESLNSEQFNLVLLHSPRISYIFSNGNKANDSVKLDDKTIQVLLEENSNHSDVFDYLEPYLSKEQLKFFETNSSFDFYQEKLVSDSDMILGVKRESYTEEEYKELVAIAFKDISTIIKKAPSFLNQLDYSILTLEQAEDFAHSLKRNFNNYNSFDNEGRKKILSYLKEFHSFKQSSSFNYALMEEKLFEEISPIFLKNDKFIFDMIGLNPEITEKDIKNLIPQKAKKNNQKF